MEDGLVLAGNWASLEKKATVSTVYYKNSYFKLQSQQKSNKTSKILCDQQKKIDDKRSSLIKKNQHKSEFIAHSDIIRFENFKYN